jgi:pimeloyl-ACP methyl ester carboxylesterase
MLQERKVDIQGIKVSYKIAGDGPAILILHGWGSRSDRWERVAALLLQHTFSLIIPDLPGFGKSEEPKFPFGIGEYHSFLKEFVDVLGLKEFYLLGHSFGGGLALAFSVKHPEKVKKLFLFAAAVRRQEDTRKSILRRIAKTVKIFSFLPFYAVFRKGVYKYVIGKSDYPYQKGVMKDSYLRVIAQDLSPLLPYVTVPTVILWGDKDDVVPLKDAHFLKEHIPNAELAILPNGDHDAEQRIPETLSSKILSFL